MNLLNEINARGTTIVMATHAKDIVNKMKNFKVKKEVVENTPSFEEEVEVKRFEFPKYVMVDEYETAKNNNYDALSVINAIIEGESPIAEDWLLKRITSFRLVTNVRT